MQHKIPEAARIQKLHVNMLSTSKKTLQTYCTIYFGKLQ